MEYKFDCVFEFTNATIIGIDCDYLDIGIFYLGYGVRNRIYKDLDFKYKIDIEDTINLLFTEFNRLLKRDEVYKFIKLDYDVVYRELKNVIESKIKNHKDLIMII